jgi:PAS domain S-box-containing protein
MAMIEAQRASPADTAIGGDALARAFPFHWVVDRNLRFVALGPSIARLPEPPVIGGLLTEHFLCLQPVGPLSAEFITQMLGCALLLAQRSSHIPFRGHFDVTAGGLYWIFLGSPSMLSLQALESAGLRIEDFAAHDRISDVLLMNKSQRTQLADLRRLKERLTRQHDEFEKSEETFLTALAAANSVVYKEDIVADTFTNAGESFATLTGHDFHWLRPSQLRQTLDPVAQAEKFGVTGEINIASPRRSMEYRFMRRDGSERWFSDDAALILDANGKELFAVGLIEDITGRKRVEEALRESEERASRLARVVELTQNAVIITGPDGRIQWVNPGFTAISGYPSAEVLGRRPQDLLSSSAAEQQTLDQALAAVRTGTSAHLEVRFTHRNGSLLSIDVEAQALVVADGSIGGFMLVCMDVTARVQLRVRLRRQRDAFAAILRLIPGGILALDGSGCVSFCNHWFAQLLGAREDGLVGQPVARLDAMLAAQCPAEDPPFSLGELLPTGREVIRVCRPAAARISRIDCDFRDAQKRRVWHVVYLSDITREAEIDEMKSQFLSIAAHELRTPMASIHGFSELLISRDFDKETQQKIASTIHRQSSLLVDMVNELLDIARIEAGGGRDFQLAEFELEPLVRDTVAAVLPSVGAPRVVFAQSAGKPGRVFADPAKVQLTLTNVLSNAYKYSGADDPVEIEFLTRAHRGAAQVGVRVSDRGIGMTPDQLSRIFERFYRADPSGEVQGTGLGMTLVKEIIEAMHGSVEVTSLVGRGTCVTLWIPVAPQPRT